MAAALPKIRMPSTTTTAVDSCAPTPSWSPRKTMNAATSTLATKEITNTLASKMWSRRARSPPNTASSAAMTAIGRYGASQSGTVGWTNSPTTTPTTRASTAYTQQSPSVGLVAQVRVDFRHGVDVAVAVGAGLVDPLDAGSDPAGVVGGVAVGGVAGDGVAGAGAAVPEDPDSAGPGPCAYRNSAPEPAGSAMSC